MSRIGAPEAGHQPGREAAEAARPEQAADAEPATPVGGLPPVAGLALRRAVDPADPLGGSDIPPDVVATLRRRSGAGQRLPARAAAEFGAELEVDLSDVRLHTDAGADRLTRSLSATAFTAQRDIYFAAGRYAPGTPAGQHLLAHELAHVADQANGADRAGPAVIGRADDPAEARAEQTADRVVSALRRQASSGPAPARPESRAADLPALRRQAVIRRTRLDAQRADSGLYPTSAERLVEVVRDTNLNDNYRLTLIRINNYELAPVHPDYIPIEHQYFPDLSELAFAAERDRVVDITRDYYFWSRSRPELAASRSPLRRPPAPSGDGQPQSSGDGQPQSSGDGQPQSSGRSGADSASPVASGPQPSVPLPSGDGSGGSPSIVGVRTLRKSDYDVLQVFASGSTKPEKIKLKPDGPIKVLKFGSRDDPEHIQTEILTQKLYQYAGIPTLPAELVLVDGVPAQLTDFVPKFEEPALEKLRASQDFWRHAGADMVFANWDLFKTANWMEIAGRMVRADLGGALNRRAQGALKTPEEFGDDVGEFDSMREKAEGINPYKRLTEAEIADSVRNLAFQLTPDKLNAAFAAAGYPDKVAEPLKKTIGNRLANALKWADKHYPLAGESVAPARKLQLVSPPPVDERESIDPWAELESMGYRLSPALLAMSPEERTSALRDQIGRSIIPDEQARASVRSFSGGGLDLLGVPASARSENPQEKPPLVGPEELLRPDQYGSPEKRKEFITGLGRLGTGVLMRRMSDGERAGFVAALAENDINAVIDLLFTKGKRGEIVLSVNEPFIFERERKKLAGTPLTAEELLEEATEKDKYKWILEIPLTDEMLDFLHSYAYVSAPPTAKPTAFLGSPNLKAEGEAGGARNADGIPNVVLKPQGFALFWQGVRKLHWVLAEEHLWTKRSSNKDLLQAKALKERQAKIEAAEAARKKKAAEPEVDPFDGGLGLPDSGDP
jgi:Domain of unknown function (DUF4157)